MATKLTATFSRGLVVRTADQLVNPRTDALIAENVDFRADGTARKAPGWEYVADVGAVIEAVAHRDDELVAFGADTLLYSYDEPRDAWGGVAPAPHGKLDIRQLPAKQGTQDGGSACTAGDLTFHAWVDTAVENGSTVLRVRYSAQRESDKAVVVHDAVVFEGTDVRFVYTAAMDDAVCIAFDDFSTNTIRAVVVPIVAPSTYTALVVGPVVAGQTVRYDLAPYDATRVIVARLVLGDPGQYTLQLVDAAGISTVPRIFETDLTRAPRVSRVAVSGPVVVSGVRPADTSVINLHDQDADHTLLDSILDVAGENNVVATTHAAWDDEILVVTERNDAGVPFAIRTKLHVRQVVISGGTTLALGSSVFQYNAELSHQPVFSDAGHCWLWFYHGAEGSQTACYVLVELHTLHIHGRAYEGNRANVIDRTVWPRMYVHGDKVWTGAPFRARATPVLGAVALNFTDNAVGLLQFDPSPPEVVAVAHRSLLYWCAAGYLQAYDGAQIFEQGWHSLPEFQAAAIAGTELPEGTYQVAVFYQSEDALGYRYQSATVPQVVTLGAPGNIEITVQGAPISTRTDITLVGVITQVDVADRFFVFTDPDVRLAPDPDGQVVITNTLTPAQYTLRESYDQLGSAPIVASEPVAAAHFVAAEEDRLWTGDPEYADLLHFSIPWADRLGLHFGVLSVIGARTGGEPSTALAFLDNSYYAFSATTVTRWAGAGPSRRGVGGFSAVQPLPTNTGTLSQNYVARLPMGLLFVSTQGPRLVARAQAATAPFEAISELYEYAGQSPGRALYLPDEEQVLIFTPTLAGDVGPVAHPPRTLRLDANTMRFSTEYGSEAVSASRGRSGEVVFLRASTNRVARFTPPTYARGGMNLGMVLSTAWMTTGLESPFTLLRLGILGRYLSPHNLVVGICYDYDDDIAQTFRLDPNDDGLRAITEWRGDFGDTWGGGTIGDPGNTAGAGGWGSGPPRTDAAATWTRYQFRIHFPSGSTPLCQAFRIILWDNQSTGASCAITAITAEVEPSTEAILTIDPRAEYAS